MSRGFPLYTQHDAMDCRPTCLRMIAAYYGQHYSAEFLRKHCFISRQGVSLLGISEASEQLGMHTIGVQLPLERLVDHENPWSILALRFLGVQNMIINRELLHSTLSL